MVLGPYYILILVFVGIILLVFAYGIFSITPSGRKRHQQRTASPVGRCPLCSSGLASGEQIKSVVFPGKTDRITHIFGCPHCYPYIEDNLRRSCPVCGKTVPPDGYLIARMFDRPGKKTHVHILGCTVCRVGRTK
ncbi:MAG TPA: hypothetical protein PK786_06470 [Treponemataceae bacterium]|nr:hypothetical protein [Treponemataceae bacterium]